MAIQKTTNMKNVIYLSIFSLLILFSCKKDKEDSYPTYKVSVQLTDTLNNNFTDVTGVSVKLSNNTTGDVYNATSDANGLAVFQVPVGIYKASASTTQTDGAQKIVYNGNYDKDITVTNTWTGTDIAKIKLVKAQLSQVIIKEVFVGGSPKDDGSGVNDYDGYIILYNNSDASATLNNLCIATPHPITSTGTNNYIDPNGKLSFEDEKWFPALWGFWFSKSSITLPPGKQIVIATGKAINNTVTYSKSINFDNPEYYALYDLTSGFTDDRYYVAPAASIPSSHFFKGIKFPGVTTTAWLPGAITSPAVYIFVPKNTTPESFGADALNMDMITGHPSSTSKKVPFDWILDGVEGFSSGSANNKKRFPSIIDVGNVPFKQREGYSIYRNVDKAATEAIAGNAGKLVYNYSLETLDTDDKSNIDAETSIKNGARIVYMDNNNSTLDFHVRSKASLRTN
jgi:hypothetical protein